MTTWTRNRRTGKRHRVDARRSAAAKRGARRRRGRHLKAATRKKISAALKRVHRTGRTRGGWRIVRKPTVYQQFKRGGRK